jgi:class 3 adenylate cyclase
MLLEAEPGQLVRELRNNPSPEQINELLEVGKDWLESWVKKDVEARSMNELLRAAMSEGPSTVSLLIDTITEQAKKMGVSNPLTHSQEHEWDNIWSLETTRVMDSVRRRYLSRQYSMRYGTDKEINEMVKRGLQAFKTNVAVMFVDIRGFTKWSADKSPDEVVEMLNKEYEVISRVVHSGGGRVNKMMGDGMLAYFPEYKATECPMVGMKIQDAVTAAGLLPVGVGCDFGEVIMGDMGQEIRLDYTLIGSVVNYASRMCDSAREGEVAISRRLFEKLGEDRQKKLTDSHAMKTVTVKIKPTDPELEGIILR